jgi:enolase
MKIKSLVGREVYDSRGWPTVQCEIVLEDGFTCVASVPTGLSQGAHEARKIYDGGERLFGRGVQKCVRSIDTIIAPEFIGKKPHAIDMDLELLQLDGTTTKSRLGANTLLAVSMAVYRAHAHCENVELFEFIGHICGADTVSVPFPFFNIINGGMHAHNGLPIQEFMIVPVGTSDFRMAMEVGATIFHELGAALQKRDKQIVFGDEGGYACSFASEREALDILTETIDLVHQKYDYSAMIALDVAASTFYDAASQRYRWKNELILAEELVDVYEDLIEKYPLCMIEDGLAEDDWAGWVYFKKRIGDKVQLFGDDLFATNPERIAHGIECGAVQGAIIKPNQIGTVTETLQAISLCQKHDILTMVSHRSGDTEDSFIADLAVGASAGQIKSGSLRQSERLAKYNRLLAIEDYLMNAE